MKTPLAAILCAVCAFTYGQNTWRNGTIITKEGNTLNGQINDREWGDAPKEIEFRRGDLAIERYTVNDIIGFSTDRPVLYESHTIVYDGDDQFLSGLPNSKEPKNLVKEKVFAEVIVNADIALLHVQSRGRLHYFIKQDTSITELLNRDYRNDEAGTSVLTYEKYKQQLFVITNDCPDIQKKLKLLSYSENRLREIFTRINQCKGLQQYPLWKGALREKKHSSLGISLQGFITNSLYLDYYESKLSAPNFGAGLFWEVYHAKKSNRLSLYSELVYKKINQPGTLYPDDPAFTDNTAELECTKFRLINAVRFSYPRESGRLYWGAGLNNGFRINTLIDDRSENISGSFSSGFELGFTAMAGKTFALGEYMKVNTEVRWEYEMDYSKLFSFNHICLSLQFHLR